MSIKRFFDFSLSLIGLCISSPLWLLIALGIVVDSGLPVFLVQERVGKDGKLFNSIKFRTMTMHIERSSGFTQAIHNDPRITRFGALLRKTALDELPQLWNIFAGDMSFVGPRALVIMEKEVGEARERSVFDFPDFAKRCRVKPGLTGVAQVFAARDITRQQKFKYDLWYINNYSFLLDIYLMLLSFLITFHGKWEMREQRFGFIIRSVKEKIEREL